MKNRFTFTFSAALGVLATSQAFAAETCNSERIAGGLAGNGIMFVDAANRFSFRYPESWNCRSGLASITVEEPAIAANEGQPPLVSFATGLLSPLKRAPVADLEVDADKFVLDIRRVRGGASGLAAYLEQRFPNETWQNTRMSGRNGYQSFGLDTSRIYLPGEGDMVYVITNSVDRDGIPRRPMQLILDTFTITP